MVLAVGAVHAKRALNQVPEALAAAQSSITQASGMASETISKATQSFAGQAKVADDSISAQVRGFDRPPPVGCRSSGW